MNVHYREQDIPAIFHRSTNAKGAIVRSIGMHNGVRCVQKVYKRHPKNFDREVEMQTLAGAAGVGPRVVTARADPGCDAFITMEQVFAHAPTADDLVDIHALYIKLDALGILHNRAEVRNFMKKRDGSWVLVDYSDSRRTRESDIPHFNVDVSFTILCSRIGRVGGDAGAAFVSGVPQLGGEPPDRLSVIP